MPPVGDNGERRPPMMLRCLPPPQRSPPRLTGFPPASVTRTEGGGVTGGPAAPLGASVEFDAIVFAAPAPSVTAPDVTLVRRTELKLTV